jgi:propanol-preferring alcohol dehydrogenase
VKAWVLDAPGAVTDDGPLRLADAPEPVPGEGELLVRVSACGLCRTDLHVCQGEIPLPRLPLVPGHQIVGTVVRGGRRFAAGERVGIAWLRETCGRCADCGRGDENLCRFARFTGYHADGGYAECATVPEAFAYALPDAVTDFEAAPLLCAGIIGYRALRQADVGPGEAVGLYGFGSSAHIALQVAHHFGCRVHVVTRGEAHRALAREMGAAWVGDGSEAPPEPLDRAVLFAPAGDLVPRALEAVRWGGTVASAAIHMSPIPPLDYDRHLFGEKTLRSTTASTRRDGEELLALAAEGVLRTHVEIVPFGEAPRGLARILRDQVRGSAVLAVE